MSEIEKKNFRKLLNQIKAQKRNYPNATNWEASAPDPISITDLDRLVDRYINLNYLAEYHFHWGDDNKHYVRFFCIDNDV